MCAGDTYSAVNGTATCSVLSPGYVGADFVDPGVMKGARSEVPCPPGTHTRSTLFGLAMVATCEACKNNTVTSAPASSTCTACPFGAFPNEERTQCRQVVEITSRSANSTADDNSLVGRAVTAAAEGKFGGKTAALAFFMLLGCCAMFFGFAAGGAGYMSLDTSPKDETRFQASSIE